MDRLEIIRATGQIEFYNLDPGKGVTNIGRHPGNDIVLIGPDIAPFHAILDHRQKPYQLVLLSHTPTRLGHHLLPPNVATPVHHRDTILFQSNTLVLLENGRPELAPPAAVTVPAGTRPQHALTIPTGFPMPTSPPETDDFVPPTVFTRRFNTVPPDTTSEAIILQMSVEREQTVDVTQIAGYQFTIINGGSIVATFVVSIAGLDGNWLMVSPAQVNLFEGERATVSLNITPPRHSTSLAGPHPFAIIVTSPNYPNQSSQRGAVLNINPYYDFAVDELTPKRQSISWFQRTGEVTVTITNKGNSEAPFRLEGEDDERACNFEFTIPGEEVGLAKQADVQVAPLESMAVPVTISPHSRRLVGFRKRTYSFTMTTTLLEGQQTPRSLLGQLKSAPLIGPVLIILTLFLLLATLFYIFWPAVVFNVNPGSITAGQEVTLAWSASPRFLVSAKLNNEPVDSPRGTFKDELHETTTYELTADTWLSNLLPGLTSREIRTVRVTPVRPTIGLFKADPEETGQGGSAVLSWYVLGADELTLTDNTLGKAENLNDAAGSRQVIPEQDTTYTLRAINASAPDEPVEKLVVIKITTPTPVLSEAPQIEFFIVGPQVISAGQSVTLQWSVAGVDSVTVRPLGDNLPPSGAPINHWPQETTLYVLSASNGQQTVNAVQQVVVGEPPTPTPTATPGAAPVIELLTTTPEEWLRLSDDDEDNEVEVQINWVVTGNTTNVELTGGPPGFEKLSNLSRIGDVKFMVNDTRVFVLTAYSGQEQVVKTTQIKFLEPTPTVASSEGSGENGGSGSATATPAPPAITSFTAAGLSAADQVTPAGGTPPVYQVVAGSNVVLNWAVNNANTVTLVSVGNQPPVGSYTLFNVVSSQMFQLTATGDGGTTQAFLQLQVVSRPIPPAPFNVNGSENAANQVTLTWDHSAENDIIGFRIYRNNGSGFMRVADESTLINSTRQWIDPTAAAICRGYYVTAVYIDPISGNRLETGASSNSWYSSSCP